VLLERAGARETNTGTIAVALVALKGDKESLRYSEGLGSELAEASAVLY
jgi:hypothetical protein